MGAQIWHNIGTWEIFEKQDVGIWLHNTLFINVHAHIYNKNQIYLVTKKFYYKEKKFGRRLNWKLYLRV